MQDYTFDNVQHALIWATEILRSNTFPKISNIYIKEALSSREDVKQRAWSGWREDLPADQEEVTLLAMKVYRSVKNIPSMDQELVLMKYWGDYYDKAYLKSTLQIKEAMRQRGQHLRLNYRFSLRQMAAIKENHFRKIHKNILRIEAELQRNLVGKGMVLPQVDTCEEQKLIVKTNYHIEM
ncbi:MAG: hypothetical protein ACI9TY_000687 [Alphaproteobacteria bacterium]|jgi:hypothetical protein